MIINATANDNNNNKNNNIFYSKLVQWALLLPMPESSDSSTFGQIGLWLS